MADTIKELKYTAEGVTLSLKFMKEISPYKTHDSIRFFIDAEIKSENQDLIIKKSEDSQANSSIDSTLLYKERRIFWMSFHPYHGLRWDESNNTTGILSYKSPAEMKECYIKSSDFIPKISNYFYKCIADYKKLKDLYDTELDEVI
jgi:hypothetical protein